MRSIATPTFTEQARREQIIRGAIEVIAEVGYANATLARIAERLSMSKGSILYHFGNRDRLMGEVVVEVYTQGAQRILPTLDGEEQAGGRLRAYLEANLSFMAADRAAVIAVGEIVRNLRDDHGGRVFDEASNQGPLLALAGVLDAGHQTGEFGPFDSKAVAAMIRDLIDGVGSRLRGDIDYDLEKYGRELIDFVLRAIGSREVTQ